MLPATLPPGWGASWAEVTNAAHSWYTHHYVDDATGRERTRADAEGRPQPSPPPGTFSLCARLAADPATAHLVGAPTHFVSHAHTYGARDFLGALEAFGAALPPAAAARAFFWIDGFAIDEHQGFYGAKGDDNSEVWAATFQAAVAQMGHTVMVLAPWDDPVVLTRLWCLWELHCTASAPGARFSVALGPAQRRAFEGALLTDNMALLDAFARIDVQRAQVGDPRDRAMILGGGGGGGAAALNALALGELRGWR